MNFLLQPHIVGLKAAVSWNIPAFRIIQDFADCFVQNRTWCTERDIADEFFPDQLLDVIKCFDVEAGIFPEFRQFLHPLTESSFHLSEPDQFHSVMVNMSRGFDGGTKTSCNTEQDVIRIKMFTDSFSCPESILDGENQSVWTDHRCGTLRCRPYPWSFGRDNHQVTYTHWSSIHWSADAFDRSVSTCSFNT